MNVYDFLSHEVTRLPKENNSSEDFLIFINKIFDEYIRELDELDIDYKKENKIDKTIIKKLCNTISATI
ncbi:hypothetical protein E4V42_07295 [Clostridium estertheticum]|uniref:Uncharacterized protein n=1 Tax=Clostridium estertheticum TaxID=238834 RepID=A0A5N7IZJ7_9CLOT|nr:hypothetical protein [Clostridium estertheticum]MPQ31241.1 hypothetical protein [Clostridium estertheticum]MPQ61915.1 hypothetical protein [Clostridium estertheticum]